MQAQCLTTELRMLQLIIVGLLSGTKELENAIKTRNTDIDELKGVAGAHCATSGDRCEAKRDCRTPRGHRRDQVEITRRNDGVKARDAVTTTNAFLDYMKLLGINNYRLADNNQFNFCCAALEDVFKRLSKLTYARQMRCKSNCALMSSTM